MQFGVWVYLANPLRHGIDRDAKHVREYRTQQRCRGSLFSKELIYPDNLKIRHAQLYRDEITRMLDLSLHVMSCLTWIVPQARFSGTSMPLLTGVINSGSWQHEAVVLHTSHPFVSRWRGLAKVVICCSGSLWCASSQTISSRNHLPVRPIIVHLVFTKQYSSVVSLAVRGQRRLFICSA